MQQIRGDSHHDEDRWLRLECLRLGYEQKRLGALDASAEVLGEQAWKFVNEGLEPSGGFDAEVERLMSEDRAKAGVAPGAPAAAEAPATTTTGNDGEVTGDEPITGTGGIRAVAVGGKAAAAKATK